MLGDLAGDLIDDEAGDQIGARPQSSTFGLADHLGIEQVMPAEGGADHHRDPIGVVPRADQ
jgi:hypothetical protein